ncbi:MAG TPA: AAA family ATPase [Polyangiaceae bacterium]|nr:AAA family ATPase [Polyangiaceae bacterium]
MQEVIIVNGPRAAGKTAVTAELRLLLPGTVAISGDALRSFAPADVRAQLGGGATYRAAGALARAYLELGAARVIFDYLCLRPAHFRYFSEALPAGVVPKIFTLWPSLEALLERERAQAASSCGPSAAANQREMAANLAAMGEILDNSALAPAPAARYIHERCAEGPAQTQL